MVRVEDKGKVRFPTKDVSLLFNYCVTAKPVLSTQISYSIGPRADSRVMKHSASGRNIPWTRITMGRFSVDEDYYGLNYYGRGLI